MTMKLQQAIEIAAYYHRDQVRKHTGEPYIVHPMAVMGRVAGRVDTDGLIAAVLHDTVEDTDLTFDAIERVFGGTVVRMVAALTDPPVQKGLNRAGRKALTRQRYASVVDADIRHTVYTIKVADLLDNTTTLAQYDPEFFPKYRGEAMQLLDVIGHDAEPRLVADLRRVLG
jgi:(p)ppGpp synthase/HD superfamily hydrolase